jgi:Mn2+/Fe2+ NRAMP family transporter
MAAGGATVPLPTERRGWLARLGPGIISGAANDDPSCLVTYVIAGATFGYATLWTSLYAFPILLAIQLIAAKIGSSASQGLTSRLRSHYPSGGLVWVVCAALLPANVLTLGADLAAMAEITARVTGGPAAAWTAGYALITLAVLCLLPYRSIQAALKWLCISAVAYIAAAFLAQPDWRAALPATLVPQWNNSLRYLEVLVAIVGATLSPYFLFWQAGQEAEQKLCAARGRCLPPASDPSTFDIAIGSASSKAITFFVTITAAATLHANGDTGVASLDQAAAALRPLAGAAAAWVFAAGVIASGLLALPALAATSAYAISEAVGWPGSLDDPPHIAPNFYAVLLISVAVGLLLVAFRIPPIDLLFWASFVNGIAAPIAILALLLLVHKGEVRASYVRALAWAGFALSALAAGAVAVMAIRK